MNAIDPEVRRTMKPTIDKQNPDSQLFRSHDYQVLRILDATAGPLIIKRCVAGHDHFDAARLALQNEQRILARLQGITGCPRLVGFDPEQLELAMADFGAVALNESGLQGRLDLPLFLQLAEKLARLIASVHEHGVIHKDINPANILVRPEDLELQLIDFGLATTFAEEHPTFAYGSLLAVTPAYMSPEQTGRMNRPVDYRTDLYSMGATLYTLATGSEPFDTSDTLGLVHAHLAQTPRPPQQQAPWLPPPVAELILTLLAKDPDDRYQSAQGVARDLQKMTQVLTTGQALDSFRLKAHDLPLSPRPPRRLYGRDHDLSTLMEAFARITRGGMRGLFVAGYSGVGKTSLIQSLSSPVTRARGLFLSGKFEQIQSNRPFLAPAQSLRQLTQWLLARPEAEVDAARRRIRDGLGPDAGALFEVLPELETLIGAQPQPPELAPIQKQRRLRALLVALIRAIAAPKRPLMLFFDDLQWADQPSLDFIAALLDDSQLNGLLLLGAYRDNEVDASHPLMGLLRNRDAKGEQTSVLTLESLTSDHTAAMLADMLHMTADAVQSLAHSLSAKTGGNPYFIVELVNSLYREGTLRPVPEDGRWHWDDAGIAARAVSANVVDFLTTRLNEIDAIVSDELLTAACLGTRCTLGLLSTATGTSLSDLPGRLQLALEHGVIVTSNLLAFEYADPMADLRFCHDRMQQAVYQLRDRAWLSRQHLSIARRLAAARAEISDSFSAALHYAQASSLITDADERAMARRLFLAAARQACQSGAFAAAEQFLGKAIRLLSEDAWNRDTDEAFALYAELHLVLYTLSRYDDADAAFAVLLNQIGLTLQLVDSTSIQIHSLSNRGYYDESINLGAALLNRLGMALPLESPLPALEAELDMFYKHVAAGALDQLASRPTLENPKQQGLAKLMNRMIPAVFFTRPLLACWLSVRLSRRWIEEGYLDHFTYPMACVTVTTILLRDDYATGYRAARAALEAGKLRNGGMESARTEKIFALLSCHWFQPLRDTLEHAHSAFNNLLRAGALEFACYTFFSSQAAVFETGNHLSQLKSENDAALDMARKTGNRHAEQSFLVFRQLVLALEGKTMRPGSFETEDFSEPEYQQSIRQNHMAQCYYHIYRALAACLFHDDAALIIHAETTAAHTTHISAFYPTALANQLHSLALLHRLRETPENARHPLLEQLARNQAWLQARSSDAPVNFAHLHAWIEAERLDCQGQTLQALQMYEQAIRQSHGCHRHSQLALITERAGYCYLRHGLDTPGRDLLTQAHDLYQRWGAVGKALAMREALLFIDPLSENQTTGSLSGEALNHDALLRASQALASQTSLTRLLDQLVELMGQLTGATDVRLLLDDGGEWFLEGGLRGSQRLGRMTLLEGAERNLLPVNTLKLLLQMREPMISDDVSIDSRLMGDPYFAALPRCSVLALPVTIQGRISACLALENRLCRAAFSAQRIETVTILCSQLATAIENIRLYKTLERKVAERTLELAEANAKLQQLSECDGLTGIANRRKFDSVWTFEFQRASRLHQPLAVALIDIDHFKDYNDRYGHQAGDECLQRVAQTLATTARRAIDLVARYGGEEFVVVVPGMTLVDARQVAEKLRVAVEELRIPHGCNSAAPVVTVSIGIVTKVPTPACHPSDLLVAADALLYQAKHAGRNRVESPA